MKRKIPKRNKDLRGYVLRRKIFKISAYALWLAVFLIGILSYNAGYAYNPNRQLSGWHILIWMIGASAVGFVLFRVWKLFTDRTFEGVIEESGLSHTYTSSADPGAANPVNYDFRLHTYLRVRTTTGKLRRVRCEQKPGFYLYYYPGTYLCRLSGLPYPISDPNRRCRPNVRHLEGAEDPHDDLSGGYICAACGFLNKKSTCACGRCGLSIIDPTELFNSPSSKTDGAFQNKET